MFLLFYLIQHNGSESFTVAGLHPLYRASSSITKFIKWIFRLFHFLVSLYKWKDFQLEIHPLPDSLPDKGHGREKNVPEKLDTLRLFKSESKQSQRQAKIRNDIID